MAVMISRAVNVQLRSSSNLMSQIQRKSHHRTDEGPEPTHNNGGGGGGGSSGSRGSNGNSSGSSSRSLQSAAAPSSSSPVMWDPGRDDDESDLWLPDFSKTLPINVEGFFSGTDYAPRVFESLREHFGISSRQYAADMGCLGTGKEGEGKSKQLFFTVRRSTMVPVYWSSLAS